jgi:mannose-6-phosphate isomerase-like protein (cupin superfamily)
MDKESLKTGAPLFKDLSSLNMELLSYDLPKLIDGMKHKHNWAEEEPDSMILLNCFDKKVVLIVLHKGTGFRSFQSNESVTFQIIEGELVFHSRKESIVLEKGQFLTLHEKIDYTLQTNDETVFLLTISNGDLQYTEN